MTMNMNPAIAETDQYLDGFARDASGSGELLQRRRERRQQARAAEAAAKEAAKADRAVEAMELGRVAAAEIFNRRSIPPATENADDLARERVRIMLDMSISSRDDYRSLPILERLAYLEGAETVAAQFGYKLKL